MQHRLVHYRVKKEAIAKVIEATNAFVDEVGRKEGGTASYQALQQEDDATRFVHWMAFRVPSAAKYHEGTAWRKRFVELVTPLCEEPPRVVDLKPLAS